jgi:DNA-binding LacI/PurR family transcriptional regulator/DNA-binding transcriptional ArsR family regulator
VNAKSIALIWYNVNCIETIIMPNLPSPPAASKLETTRLRLEELAHTLGANAQMPPIRQLCADFGVSLSTMGAALAALEDRNLIRRRQGSGIFVAEGIRQHNLSLICDPNFLLEFGASSVWSQLVHAARQRAGDLDENLSIHFTQLGTGTPDTPATAALHDRLAGDIAGGNVQGVLSIGLPHALTRWIEGCGVPMVSFAGPSNFIVWLSALEVIQVAVAELAKQGCRALAVWSPTSVNRPEPPEIRQTFFGALAAHGLEYRPEFARPLLTDKAATISGQGFAAMEQVLRSERLPDGLICTDDMLAQGALMALERHGRRVGEDIHVATQANRGSPALLAWEDRITRLEFDPAEIVATMFEALGALMRGETPTGVMPAAPNPEYPHYHPPEQLLLIRPRLIRPAGDVS